MNKEDNKISLLNLLLVVADNLKRLIFKPLTRVEAGTSIMAVGELQALILLSCSLSRAR